MIVVPTEAGHNFSYVFVITSLFPHELFLYIFLYFFFFLYYSMNKDFVDVVHDNFFRERWTHGTPAA